MCLLKRLILARKFCALLAFIERIYHVWVGELGIAIMEDSEYKVQEFVSQRGGVWVEENGRYFVDDIFMCIFLKENIHILIQISLNLLAWDPLTIVQYWNN